MVREQIEVAIDRVGLGLLDVTADALVQHRPERERHALVGDLLRDDVLEQVRLVGFLFEVDESTGAERPQLFLHLVESAELGVDAGQHRRAEDAAEDARDLQCAPRRLGELVDAAQDEAVQALRQLEPLQSRLVLQVDPLAADEVEQFLDVERIPLRPRGHELDERGRRCRVAAEHLLQLRADQLRRVMVIELGERDLARSAAGSRCRARRPTSVLGR